MTICIEDFDAAGILCKELEITYWNSIILNPISAEVKLFQVIGKRAYPDDRKNIGTFCDLVSGYGFCLIFFQELFKIYKNNKQLSLKRGSNNQRILRGVSYEF